MVSAVFFPKASRAVRLYLFPGIFFRTGLFFAVSPPVTGAMLELTRFLSAGFLAGF